MGQRYDKEVLNKMKPPSFLGKESERLKKKILFSIEVSVTPTKSGRIGIKNGDNLQKVAQNFCKAYQLNKEMEDSLVCQLQNHMDKYIEDQENKKMIKSQARKNKEDQNEDIPQSGSQYFYAKELQDALKLPIYDNIPPSESLHHVDSDMATMNQASARNIEDDDENI